MSRRCLRNFDDHNWGLSVIGGTVRPIRLDIPNLTMGAAERLRLRER